MRWKQPGKTAHLFQVSSLLPETEAHRQHQEPDTHHNDKDNRASKTPDKRFVDGDPTEVRVSIALWVQPNSKAFEKRRGVF